MIAFVRGNLAMTSESMAVIDCMGIGYEVAMSASDISRLPSIGTEITVYTYLNVNENSGVGLFGFLTRDALEMFRLLITVSGIGPKGAQAILSGLDADALRFAILAEDVNTISKAPGIGKKTASKLVLELKDKISFETAIQNKLDAGVAAVVGEALSTAKEEAILALVALGYSKTEATQAVSKVPADENMTVDEILGQSLRYM